MHSTISSKEDLKKYNYRCIENIEEDYWHNKWPTQEQDYKGFNREEI